MNLFVDYETLDLYLKGEPSEHPGQPWPCSVSAILDDQEGRTWAEFYTLIKVPREAQWAPKAQETNKLNHDICDRYGVPLEQALKQLTDMLMAAQNFVAYSSFFDGKFTKIAAAKVGGTVGKVARQVYESKRRLCTMEASARHFVGPDARFLKLKIAYEKAFGSMFEGAHGAHADNHAQRRLFYWLKEKGCADFADTVNVSQPDPDRARGNTTTDPATGVELYKTDGSPPAPLAAARKGKPGAIAF